MSKSAYEEFIEDFSLLVERHPELITTTLSNIFTMRLIGNKTHGDLAEIAISEFVNQYMSAYESAHVGKDLYRAKASEEDITVENLRTKKTFPISLKAYGNGPLQLSTDKSAVMFPLLESFGESIDTKSDISKIFKARDFSSFEGIHVFPLIYDERKQQCNIMVFNSTKARKNTALIKKITESNGRKHPVYRFYDSRGGYICEVRYGGPSANALQRGLWTHTKNALDYFDSVTKGWIDYSHNAVLVKLFSHALVSSRDGHSEALKLVAQDIGKLRKLSES